MAGTLAMPPQERLAAVSTLILSHPDAAVHITPWLAEATGRTRLNTPVSRWLPQMVEAKHAHPLVAGRRSPPCAAWLCPRAALALHPAARLVCGGALVKADILVVHATMMDDRVPSCTMC